MIEINRSHQILVKVDKSDYCVKTGINKNCNG